MKKLLTKEIRKKWIGFFSKKLAGKKLEHAHIPSASLVPDNPTLLLNAAGMVQFVPIFLGTKEPPSPPRAITIQKCVRVGGKDSDLENIGRTSRHHSFFEMLGNFSFGDYFKAEAIEIAWQFVREELELPQEKLHVSIFAGDDQNDFDAEAHKIWTGILGNDSDLKQYVSDKNLDLDEYIESKIKRMGRKDNFWGPPGPTGPCGPCSEIHFDRGEHIEDPDERFLEIWNLVFMEFDKDEEGKFSPLARKNIDTGAGLERIAMILQEKSNTFETDEFAQIIEEVKSKLNVSAGLSKDPEGLYLKIIADHLRCLCFLIADGVRPSNLSRGYVLRMIIRRAARFAFLLTGLTEPSLFKIVSKVVEIYDQVYGKIYGRIYPELNRNEELIKDITRKEEEQFLKTIEKGTEILSGEINRIGKSIAKQELAINSAPTLGGDFVFDLYSTYGFPLELTEEIAKEQGVGLDLEGYEKAREEHSKASSTEAFKVSVLSNKEIPEILKEFGDTRFLGYDDLLVNSKIVALLSESGERIQSASPSDRVQIVLDQTSFYAESGGQVGDQGCLYSSPKDNPGILISVKDTKKVDGLFLHSGVLEKGSVAVGDQLVAEVDPALRKATIAHHSNCHLLQAALKKVLGDQIQQAGSQVCSEYTRFDFNFDRKPSPEELQKVEDQINEWIQMELPVKAEEMSMDEATKRGALAFFEEKYGDTVRVLSMGNEKELASVELCGGTHVSNTSEIELAKLVSEGSIAAGIRRIKMVVGDLAREFEEEQKEKQAQAQAKAEAQEKAKAEAKAKKKEMAAKALAMQDEVFESFQEGSDQDGNKFYYISKELKGLDGDSLKALVEALRDKAKDKHESFAILLATVANERPVFVSAVSQNLIKSDKPVLASNLVKEAAKTCGGGGGGRPDFAQAGGRDASKVQEALKVLNAPSLK